MPLKRLSIEISDVEQIRMHNLIPWGTMSRIMRILLVQTLDLVEKHGDVVLGALLTGHLTSLDILRKEEQDGTIRPQAINQSVVRPRTDDLDSEY